MFTTFKAVIWSYDAIYKHYEVSVNPVEVVAAVPRPSAVDKVVELKMSNGDSVFVEGTLESVQNQLNLAG